jgi:hypothetical protein
VHTIAVEFDAKFGAALDIHAATNPIFVRTYLGCTYRLIPC